MTIQDQILELLKTMCRDNGLAMLFITHNMGVVADLCDDVAVMYAGEVVETGDIFAMFERPRHPYTEGLLAPCHACRAGATWSRSPAPPRHLGPCRRAAG